VVRQLVPETVADLFPQLYESLPGFDVDVRLLGQKVCDYTSGFFSLTRAMA
jgi:hypothetical protein